MKSRSIKPYISIDPKAESDIRHICIPQEARIPLLQHYGKEANPIVRLGEEVREGQLIGYSTDGTGVHASIPGIIQNIETIQLPNTENCTAVTIKLKGSFSYTGKSNTHYDWKHLSPHQLIEIIRQKGLVQLDGSAQSLSQVLLNHQSENIQNVIINAAYGTPYVLSEASILNTYSERIIIALEILQHILNKPTMHLVCTKNTHSHSFKQLARSRGLDIRIRNVPERYPEGSNEYIQAYTFKKNRLSVFTVSTLLSLYEGVSLHKGLIERIITFGGSALGKSITVKVRIGTSLNTVFQEIAELLSFPQKIITGFPIQGHIVSDINTPITKQITSVFALSKNEIGEEQEIPCIHCGKCVENCPANLEPVILHKLIQNNSLNIAMKHGLNACWFCGICSHICPSHIPLTEIMRNGLISASNEDIYAG